MPVDDITPGELEDVVATAATELNALTDSDEEAPDEAEVSEEADLEDEQPEEDEVEDADEDDDLDDVEDEDDEDVEEDDLEDEELDDEEDEEAEEDEEEEEGSSSEALDFDPDLVVKRPDGSTATLKELHEGNLRHDDYTRKTQRVADVYKKMEQWYEQRANNPPAWIAEIAHGTEDPSEAIAEAIRSTGNATVLVGQTLRHLVESGELADDLVEVLNLKQVAEQAKDSSLHQEVQTLREQIQQRDQQQQQEAELAQVEQQINFQWENLVQQNGLEFETPEQEFSEKVKVLEFARDNGIPNVEHAYLLMSQLAGGNDEAPATRKKTTSRKKASEAVKSKKRKSTAMSRKPTGGGGGRRTSSKKDSNPVDDAAQEALAELGLSLD